MDASAFKEQALQAARAGVESSKKAVAGQIDGQSTRIGGRLVEVARSMRASDASGSSAAVADSIEGAGAYLRDGNLAVSVNDLAAFGRRRPGVVALGSLLTGFAASRLLKASSAARRFSREGNTSYDAW